MPELRWHPLLEEWVGTAEQRQTRTFFPPDDYCPLCATRPGGFPTEIPREHYEIAVFQNRFPAFVPEPEARPAQQDELYRRQVAQGICEVIVYSPEHTLTLTDLSIGAIDNLVAVWTDRYAELSAHDFVKYVYIFENKGREIGVTLPHPHGQIYAFPYIPPIPQRELDASLRYFQQHGGCLFCEIIKREHGEARRIVSANDHFVAFIPYFARWPYETHVYARRHVGALTDLDGSERRALARLLKDLLTRFDNLWQRSFPYIMLMHQRPTDGQDYSYFHFHIEFYPPYRSADRLKYLAGVESGCGTFLNDTVAEEKAAELRAVKGHKE